MCSLLARAGITCYSFHALCITADRIGLTVVAVQECAQPYLHSGHAPYYTILSTNPPSSSCLVAAGHRTIQFLYSVKSRFETG
jgi:hypothetical protein